MTTTRPPRRLGLEVEFWMDPDTCADYYTTLGRIDNARRHSTNHADRAGIDDKMRCAGYT